MAHNDSDCPMNMNGFLPQTAARQFRFRTVWVPVLFLGLHYVITNLVASLYLVLYIMITENGSQSDILAWFQDGEALNQLLLEQYPVISAFCAAALIPIYLFYLMISRRRDPRVLLTGSVRARHLLPAAAMMVGALGVTTLWFNFLMAIQDKIPLLKTWMTDYDKHSGAFTPAVGYFWLILGISILTPVTEELIFRGIIQGELRKAMPEWAAVIAQAVIFALFHMQPVQISYVLLPGILLGLAYAWSGSIWVPIAMHCLFNFLGSVVPTWIGDNEALGNGLAVVEIAFILAGLAAAVYFYRNRRGGPANNSSGS